MLDNFLHAEALAILRWLEPNPNLPERQLAISRYFYNLGNNLFHEVGDSFELVAGLRKLLEAKDCFVRASMEGGE